MHHYKEERFSTPLLDGYTISNETRQVIYGRTVESSPQVRRHFTYIMNYGLEDFLNIHEVVYEDAVRLLKHDHYQSYRAHNPIQCPQNSYRVQPHPFYVKS